MVDLPFWELCNQSPVASTAISCMCSRQDGYKRDSYYLVGSVFYKYDLVGDCYQQLASPNVAPTVGASMIYAQNQGYHGSVLSAGSNSVVIPGLKGKEMVGAKITIEDGTGAGQERILSAPVETVNDFGVITATTTASLSDSLKKWKFNQWKGYLAGITFGTDATQYKKVLYNDQTTLYFSDANLQPHDHWNNQPFIANAPYALPVVTAGLQAHYKILSTSFTVDSAWTTIPDYTSTFNTDTGGIYLLSSLAAAPFYSLQYYDCLHDQWQTKTTPQSLILAALGTDFSLVNIGKYGSAFITSTATAGSARTLTDTVQTMTPNRYANHRIRITSGTGRGQSRRIVCNTATVFIVEKSWDITPDATSIYEVWADYDKIFMGGNAASAIYSYSEKNDFWSQGENYDDGITSNITVKINGWKPVGISTGVRIAAGVQSIASSPTAGGSGYVVGDILTCSVGGTGAQVIVTSIDTAGAVTGLELVHSGTVTGFTTGTGKATTGGTGTLCTINITTVGPTALITTASSHWFKNGDSITFAGCSEGAWNAQHTIIGVNSTTSFSVAITATANMAASNSQSTTLIVDSSKNWTPNEFVGKLVHLEVSGVNPTSQIRWITANTANTLTVATIVAGVNGTSKYQIYDAKAFGCEEIYKQANKARNGFATGGSPTTLVDSTKNWDVNQWAGYKMRIEAGTGLGSGIITITSNTSNTLNFTAQGFTPDATTFYEVADSWGLMTAGTIGSITETGTKNWKTNYLAGKRVRVTGGTALGQEASITSNTGTVLTTGAITAPDATSSYSILSIPVRGAGIELLWIFGNSDAATKGKFLFFPRGGGSNTFDIFDLTTVTWEHGRHYSPQQEVFSTGAMYAYDGGDKIYLHASSATVGRIFALDFTNDRIVGAFQVDDTHGAVLIGNRMMVCLTADLLKYLYVMQHTGQKLWRALIF